MKHPASLMSAAPSRMPGLPSLLSGLPAVALLWLILFADLTHAQRADAVPGSPAESTNSDSIWYDAERGGVVPVEVEPEVDDSLNRNSRWLPKAQRVQQAQGSAGTVGGGGGGGGGMFGTNLSIGNLIGWVLLISIIAAAVSAILYAMSKAEFDSEHGGRSRSAGPLDKLDEQTIERMKHLPSELRRTDVNLRVEAERLMGEHNYEQAIILLFGHQLLLLDHTGLLRLNRGKTNRRYVRETRGASPELAGILQRTVTAFERSYFGRHRIDHNEFDQLWQQNLELERAVSLRQETAA